MKILELEIENVRGVRKKIPLKPNGENVVLYGPNGTGKSAIVDAIDFLFTGDVSRLSGRGSKGMSLKDHGPHIDAEPKEAIVKAKVLVDGIKPISIERTMANPKALITSNGKSEIFLSALEIANKGQHVLSRGEILKYIAAESGKRAEEVQAILNLSTVDEIRKTLVTSERDAAKKLQTDKENYETSVSILKTKLGLKKFSEMDVLTVVNESRKVLKGDPLDSLNPEKLKEGLTYPSQDASEKVNPDTIKNAISAISKLIKEKGDTAFKSETELRQHVNKLKKDDSLKKELANKRLLALGISLLDDKGSCPLCLTEWPPGQLKPLLEGRFAKAIEAEKAEVAISTRASQINTEVSSLKLQISSLAVLCKRINQGSIADDLISWADKLEKWSSELKNSSEDYSTEQPDISMKEFLKPNLWNEYSEKLNTIADGLTKLTPEQIAWDALTGLKPILERYYVEKQKFNISKKFAEDASILASTYTSVKDSVLNKLYKSVNEDFTSYYKYLHGDDEKTFYSELKPDGSQLDFKVDFYGRGAHHPRALHSEGHQDSMGLCLYLALNKKISGGKVKVTILDDVVMSIDSGHRRNICRLFKEFFPDHQFIITTHNKTWARQLLTDGVVTGKNMIEFKGWSVDTGPNYSESNDVWSDIYKKLEENNISSAAHQLREHLEFYYENVCASLRAEVCYKGDGRWELGDFLTGAIKSLKANLSRAKKAAKNWGNEDEIQEYTELETQLSENVQRTQMEQWGINENVHFSKWADFSKPDFLPIVEAFQDLEGNFSCPQCRGLISIQMKKYTYSSLKCPCGKTSWNLEGKK